MVDLDSNPTKLIEIVEIGKQLLMTRGALTTFSIANDVAKYFAIIPGGVREHVSGARRAQRDAASQRRRSAILSAVIFNALIIPALIPLALKGVKYRAGRRGGDAAAEHADLRRRRHRCCRSSASRSIDIAAGRRCISPDERTIMFGQLLPALRMLVAADGADRRRLSASRHRHRAGRVPARRQRQPDPSGRQGSRARALIGQPFDDPKYFWSRPSATSPMPYNARRSCGFEPGPAQSGAGRRGEGPDQGAARRRSGQQGGRCPSIW